MVRCGARRCRSAAVRLGRQSYRGAARRRHQRTASEADRIHPTVALGASSPSSRIECSTRHIAEVDRSSCRRVAADGHLARHYDPVGARSSLPHPVADGRGWPAEDPSVAPLRQCPDCRCFLVVPAGPVAGDVRNQMGVGRTA